MRALAVAALALTIGCSRGPQPQIDASARVDLVLTSKGALFGASHGGGWGGYGAGMGFDFDLSALRSSESLRTRDPRSHHARDAPSPRHGRCRGGA